MAARVDFEAEIAHLLYAMKPNPVQACLQCGTCSAACPVASHMDHSPRQLIAMIRAGEKEAVLASNTCWACASCYECTARCPAGIDVARLMYGLKRYAIWRRRAAPALIAPEFSRRFMRMVTLTGRSWEPALAPSYLWRGGVRGVLEEGRMALALILRGRMPLWPRRIRHRRAFRAMLREILPTGGRA